MSTNTQRLIVEGGYNPCDIADALLKLKHPDPGQQNLAGFLCDIIHRKSSWNRKRCLGPAFTVQFQPKDHSQSSLPRIAESNIPPGKIWSDLVSPDSIVVVQQPEGQSNAVVGGIHMERLNQRKAMGLVVDGRIRDLGELAEVPLAVGCFLLYTGSGLVPP